MTTQKKVYLDAQAACGLKAGDWVRVIREPERNEAGWSGLNIYDISEMVGRVFQVDAILSVGIAVKRDDPNFISLFPYFVLEKVDKPEHKFKPFDRVLVRDRVGGIWRPDIFSHYITEPGLLDDPDQPFQCLRDSWCMCIPYEGNEHLAGTTGDPNG